MRFRPNLQALSIVEVLVCDHFHQRKVVYMEYANLKLQSALESALALALEQLLSRLLKD
jgi:hypothetical protein